MGRKESWRSKGRWGEEWKKPLERASLYIIHEKGFMKSRGLQFCKGGSQRGLSIISQTTIARMLLLLIRTLRKFNVFKMTDKLASTKRGPERLSTAIIHVFINVFWPVILS